MKNNRDFCIISQYLASIKAPLSHLLRMPEHGVRDNSENGEVVQFFKITYLPGGTETSNVTAGDGLSRQSDAKDQRYVHLYEFPVRRAVTCAHSGPYYIHHPLHQGLIF